MSAQPSALRITTPSGLVAACPPLLGFEPEPGDLVALISDVPFRTSPVTLRADLAGVPAGSEQLAALAWSMANTGGGQVDLVCFADGPDDLAREDLPTAAILGDLVARLGDCGVAVGLAITTNLRTWWSHECEGSCCPPLGTPLDLSEMDAVRAEFVFAGMAPAARRDALRVHVASEPERAQRMGRHLRLLGADSPVARRSGLETWRDARIESLSTLLLPPAPSRRSPISSGDVGDLLTDADVAAILAGLADVRVRDTILFRIAVAEAPALRTARDVLAEALRAAPDGHAAPVASVLAMTAWSIGEGALANMALDRGDADDPVYALAGLARRMMAAGLDPRSWRAGIAGLGEERCRNRGPQEPRGQA